MKYNSEILNRIIEVYSRSSNTGLDNIIIDRLKKGGSIHIKKSHKGRFTDYCGGKVTNECIARGKRSSDPKVRKMATFAANARKWNK